MAARSEPRPPLRRFVTLTVFVTPTVFDTVIAGRCNGAAGEGRAGLIATTASASKAPAPMTAIT